LNSAVQEITTRFAAWSPGAYDERIGEIDREMAAQRRSMAETDTELRSLREEETYPHSLMNGAFHGTASAIAQRVAEERERFGWLQVPREARDDPPITQNDIVVWLRIRPRYDDGTIANAKLRVINSETLPEPESFSIAVATEREAKEAVFGLAQLQDHPAYRSIIALEVSDRANLDHALRELKDRRRELMRRDYDWMSDALTAALGGRQARWQALHDQSRRLMTKSSNSSMLWVSRRYRFHRGRKPSLSALMQWQPLIICKRVGNGQNSAS
jgi:hypothetical protein